MNCCLNCLVKKTKNLKDTLMSMPDESPRPDRQEEITRLITRFTEIWRKYPNLKFNQLIYYINNTSVRLDTDYYFIDDEEFSGYMKKATSPGGDLQRRGL